MTPTSAAPDGAAQSQVAYRKIEASPNPGERLIRFVSGGKWHLDTNPHSTYLEDHRAACGLEPRERALIVADTDDKGDVCKRCLDAPSCGCGGNHISCPGPDYVWAESDGT